MSRLRSSLVLLSVATVTLASCVGDDAGNATSPIAPVAPAAATPGNGNLSINLGGTLGFLTGTVTGLVDNLIPSLLVCLDNGGPYTNSQVIGPQGGMMYFGPHWIQVPAGALSTPTRITATTLPGDTIAVDFQPHGLQFQQPVMLGLNYRHCGELLGTQQDSLGIQYVNDSLTKVLENVPSTNQYRQGEIDGVIKHFSVYAATETRYKR